jgi:hypothetical protein
VEETDGEYQAWTGSHHLSAAIEVGLESVPVFLVDTEDYAAAVQTIGEPWTCMDYERQDWLEKAARATELESFEEAASLMADESRLI